MEDGSALLDLGYDVSLSPTLCWLEEQNKVN
jgi:hypothetical protein